MIRDSKITTMLLCALAVPAMPVAAQEAIGRLFFTPSQRASLDVARSQRARATLATERTEEQAAPAAQTITYGGMVRRSDGKSTVWINNRPVHDNEPAGSAVVGRVRPDGSVSLQVPQSGRSVELKPGQSIELLSGAIEESYSRRPIASEPSPPPKAAAKPDEDKQKAAERARSGREREEQTRKLEDALRAMQNAASARGATGSPPPAPPPGK